MVSGYERSMRTVAAMAAATAVLGAVTTPLPAVTLAATALYMGGTFGQLSVPQDSPEFIGYYIGEMSRLYVDPSGLCAGGDPGCVPLGVYTPEELRGVTGWGDMTFDESVTAGLVNLNACLRGSPCVVTPPPYTLTSTATLTDTAYTVASYSQSGTIATNEKRALIAAPMSATTVSFVFVANPNRPNGGILQRFAGAYIPILGVTFNGATPTNSAMTAPLTTVDVAGQYDLIADFPTNPLNLLADLNAVLGYYTVHLRPFAIGSPELQGTYQDSTYYLIPAATLPLLVPVQQIPFVGPLLAAVLDPPLRVLVEAGYDRTINPGAPTPANWLYFPNPIATAINVATAIPVGLDNGVAYLSGDPANRPFGTTPPGPYGVGGPPVNAGPVDPYGTPTPMPALAPMRTTPAPAQVPSARPPRGAASVADRTEPPPRRGLRATPGRSSV